MLYKHILQGKHILYIKEENNFHTATCKLLWDDGTSSFRYGKFQISMWKTKLLNVPDKIAFQILAWRPVNIQ